MSASPPVTTTVACTSRTAGIPRALAEEVHRTSRDIARRKWRHSRTPEEVEDAAASAFASWWKNAVLDPTKTLLHPAKAHASWVATRASNYLDREQSRRRRDARYAQALLCDFDLSSASGQASCESAQGASMRDLARFRHAREACGASMSGDDAETSVVEALDAARNVLRPLPATVPLAAWQDALARLLRAPSEGGLGWLAVQVAEALGCSHGAITHWRRGKDQPHPNRRAALIRLADLGALPPARQRGPIAPAAAGSSVRDDLSALRARGLGPAKLSRALGCSECTVIRWARGQCDPEPATRLRIAALARGEELDQERASAEADATLRAQVVAALRAAGWRVTAAARALGIPHQTLRFRALRLGVDLPVRRGGRVDARAVPAQ